ncbi:hemolysin family protein [Candidatus Gracilibacteria bacterium]|nr:hemolysin family protein [Candidatus Gracilibacteria bacterium]
MDPWQYGLFIVLFLLSGFFSGTEIALMSLPSHKVESLLKQKLFGSKALSHIKSNTDKLLITILVGNNLVNVYTAALATQLSISFAKTSGIEESLAIGMATGLITFLILVFGEIVPKSFATKNAQSISLKVAPIYKVLMILLFPVIFFLEILIKVFTGKNVATKVTDEEIESFIDLGKDSGALEDDEHEMLKNTLEFGDTLIEEIMVPRVKVDALPDDMTVEEALEYYLTHTHSRIPVYHKQIDNIIGILTIRDILRERRAGHNDKKLKALHFKKFLKAPINQPIDTLLENFKSSRQHIAVVMDEYGGVAGITTIEDVVEEVFGEIHDETDFETDEIIENEDGSFTIDSSILMNDIVDEFELELADLGMNEKEFGSETVSYMITHKLERFPKQDEEICFKIYDEDGKNAKLKLYFKILEIDESTIGKIQVSKK